MQLDRAGRRRSPATMPGFHAGRAPRNKGLRYPADPPKVEEIVAVMRAVGEGRIVYGSDHPWAGSPGEHRRLPLAVGDANPRRLLAGTGWTR